MSVSEQSKTAKQAVALLARKLARRHGKLSFCYEAGPCGYAIYRQLADLGHDCQVVAPSLIPTKPGDHIKTDHRDAVTLARLLRAGELTAVWVPDQAHEAMRDLVRGRIAVMQSVQRAARHYSQCRTHNWRRLLCGTLHFLLPGGGH